MAQRHRQHARRRCARRRRTARRRTWRSAARRRSRPRAGSSPRSPAPGRRCPSGRAAARSLNVAFSASGSGNVSSLSSARLVVLVEHRRERLAARRLRAAPAPRARAAPARRSAALIGRIGRQGALALLALAAELGGEGRAHARGESAARSSSRPAGWPRRRCPCPRPAAPRRRSAAGARRRAISDPRPLRLLSMPARLQQLRRAARRRRACTRHPLADAFDLAPRVGEHASPRPPGRSGAAGSAGLPRSRAVAGLHRRRPPGRRS